MITVGNFKKSLSQISLVLILGIGLLLLGGCGPSKTTLTGQSTPNTPERAQGQPGNTNAPSASQPVKELPAKLQPYAFAFKTFILWVPGTSYSVDNFDRQTSTIYTSAGTLPESTITISPDGTYIWNSKWDGKTIHGNWSISGDGSLSLLRGQEGKTWTVQRGGGKNEDIFLLDGHTWYSGKSVTLKNK